MPPPPSLSRINLRHWSPAWALGALFASAWSPSARAEPVPHEYVTMPPGTEPFAVRPMPSGPADERSSPLAPSHRAAAVSDVEPTESETLDPASLPSLEIDNDTTTPENTDYQDPFTPTIAPFKRAVVYDHVDRLGRLGIADSRLVPVRRVRRERPADEHFHASIAVELIADQALPLPSVAPGARFAIATLSPKADFQLLRDSADNWYIRSPTAGPRRLTLQIVVDRGVFGSEYPAVRYSALKRQRHPTPPEVTAAARGVAEVLGLKPNDAPQRIVRRLVQHFRGFRPSEIGPTGEDLQLYRGLALGGRGICRHRSYAFAVTALGLGIPTRYAMNEAHAWVEVFDGSLWHRIDLGGGASELEVGGDPERPPHVEPNDPFGWPEPPIPAQNAELPIAKRPIAEPPIAEPYKNESQRSVAPRTTPLTPQSGSARIQPTIVLTAVSKTARRGQGLLVRGSVRLGRKPCRGAEVNIVLKAKDGSETTTIGTLLTTSRGTFQGQLIIPWQASVGDYQVTAEVTSTSFTCRGSR